jgi:glycosyltransferase involved in cell wall biosynthesis
MGASGFLISLAGVTGISAIAMNDQRGQVLRSLTEEPPYLTEGPLVSIIVPALEEEKYLPNLLASIQHQTYTPIEVIVVDQSPTESYEATQDLCREYGASLVHLSELGPSIARNRGAEVARGDILILSDADNILAQACIENLVKALEKGYILVNPVQCIYDYEMYGLRGGIYSVAVLWTRNWLKPRSATTCCVGIWKDAYFEVGGYDESCDPMQGCREDLRLGNDVVEMFGQASAKLVRGALVGTSERRLKKQPLIYPKPWKDRTVRKPILY